MKIPEILMVSDGILDLNEVNRDPTIMVSKLTDPGSQTGKNNESSQR